MPAIEGKNRKETDSESVSSEKKDAGASFDVYHSEAITFQAIGEYRKSINSYTKVKLYLMFLFFNVMKVAIF